MEQQGNDNKAKLFVSNLDFEVETDQLRSIFEEVAPPMSVVIARDRDTKRSRGFAFVEMESEDSAKKVIEALNNREINGRPMRVAIDRGKNAAPAGVGADSGAAAGGAGRSGSGERGPRRKFEILPPIQRTQLFRRKRKMDPFSDDPTKPVDYKDVAIISRFVSDRGRILSRRLTGLSAFNQRKVAKAVKRAQGLGLLPYSR